MHAKRGLAQMMRATDFVLSGRMTAKTMVQVAEDRHKKAILNDLLSDGGSSIYMKPITRYVQVDQDVDFYTLGASAVRYGEIAIGYKRFGADGEFEVCVNPKSKSAARVYSLRNAPSSRMDAKAWGQGMSWKVWKPPSPKR